MEILHSCCAGLDVHKKTVVACVRRFRPRQRSPDHLVRTFATTTMAIEELAAWLKGEQVVQVAMESTGVYWRPIWNLLEGRFTLTLVNARHIKRVPGRKTDVKDSAWIAQLLQHGLPRASFVPPPPQRQLRELTRQRRQVIQGRSDVSNRIQKVLEDANIKLSGVATDILGVSGRAMLEALLAGNNDAEAMAELARGRMRAKLPQLREALTGRVTDHHRFLLRGLLDQTDQAESQAARLSQRIEEILPAAFRDARDRLATIPGVGVQIAECILAEIGVDMTVFPTPGHLSAWAGLCPGQRDSGSRQGSGRSRPGNRWLRTILVQAAWAASHTKDTYLAAQFHRLVGRRGKKRALVAVAHSQLVIAHHLLKEGTVYREIGADYFDRLDVDRATKKLVHRLEELGHKVTLTPVTAE